MCSGKSKSVQWKSVKKVSGTKKGQQNIHEAKFSGLGLKKGQQYPQIYREIKKFRITRINKGRKNKMCSEKILILRPVLWKCLNRLRTYVGRCRQNMKRWGYSSTSDACECGLPQTMDHLCSASYYRDIVLFRILLMSQMQASNVRSTGCTLSRFVQNGYDKKNMTGDLNCD